MPNIVRQGTAISIQSSPVKQPVHISPIQKLINDLSQQITLYKKTDIRYMMINTRLKRCREILFAEDVTGLKVCSSSAVKP